MSERAEWISVKESNPPTGCIVFICKGRDVGIGVYMDGSRAWHLFSGHWMVPDYWKMIEFPEVPK